MADPEVTWDHFLLPDDDKGPMLNGVVWGLTIVAAAILGLRLYCKFSRGRGLWVDDYWLIASWISLALLASFNSASISHGFGRHSFAIADESFPLVLLHANLAGSFSIIAAAWSKTSFAFTLLRIADLPWVRRFIWAVVGSLNVALGGGVLVTWVQCWPVEKTWRPNDVEGQCWPKGVHVGYNVFAAVYSGLMDFVLALLPWVMIWRAGTESLGTRERVGVLVAMSMGIFAGIVSFLKIPSVFAIGDSDIIETVDLVIWGAAESAATVVAASIPVLRLLVQRRTKVEELRVGTDEEAILRSKSLSKHRVAADGTVGARAAAGAGRPSRSGSTVKSERGRSGSGAAGGDVEMAEGYGGESGSPRSRSAQPRPGDDDGDGAGRRRGGVARTFGAGGRPSLGSGSSNWVTVERPTAASRGPGSGKRGKRLKLGSSPPDRSILQTTEVVQTREIRLEVGEKGHDNEDSGGAGGSRHGRRRS